MTQMDHGVSWVLVLGKREPIPNNTLAVIDVTSRSKDKWTHALSPFFLGPITLYDNIISQNMENAWQYCKVYEDYQINNKPTKEYWNWAKEGWNNKKPVRFPMGRGAKPLFSYWKKRNLGYIEARKEIYAPLYAKYVTLTDAYHRLECLYEKAKKEEKYLVLIDFDGHNSQEELKSYKSILYNYKMLMGHAFVLAMLLDKQYIWEDPYNEELIHHTSIKKRQYDNPEESKTSIFIQNIPLQTKDDEFVNLFQHLNPIKCFIARNRKKESKGYGFIDFNSNKEQQEALTNTYTIHNTELTISPSYIKQQK